MHLTRKNFCAIAATIAAMPADQRKQLAETLAITLASTNPRFDRAKFLDACKIEKVRVVCSNVTKWGL